MNHKKIGIITIPLFAIVSLAWYFFHRTPHYNIIPIDSFNEALTSTSHCHNETLITFDVDDTLITTNDPLISGVPYPLLFKILVLIKYPELLQRERLELVSSTVISHAHFFLTEPTIVQTIKKLQKNGCHIIGLTAIETGSFGIIPSFEEWRSQMLHNCGIDFNNSFNKDIVLNSLPQSRDNYPHFSNGIICTNQQEKGDALKAFLEKTTFKPKAVISFDDDIEALKSIAHACTTLNIPFTGYHYYGAKKLKPVWNMNLALAELDDVIKIKKIKRLP
jgi:hypothetical protein